LNAAISQKDLEQAISDQQTAEGALRAARDALRIFARLTPAPLVDHPPPLWSPRSRFGRRRAGPHRKITLYFAGKSELPQEAGVAYADLRSVCLRPSYFNVDPYRFGSVDLLHRHAVECSTYARALARVSVVESRSIVT
jgi:hypothetical protein